MKVYVDSENKIRAVGTTTDTSLTEVFIDETADTFPFKGWSTAKICCYKVSVVVPTARILFSLSTYTFIFYLLTLTKILLHQIYQLRSALHQLHLSR